MSTGPLDVVDELLDRAGVPYALIGGHAVNAYVEPRVTADIDVTVVASPAELAGLSRVLLTAGFAQESSHGEQQPSGPDFQRWISSDAAIVLEIQVGKTALQREIVARTGEGRPRVASPEDLIVLKLIADRPKDQADLIALGALPDLDWAYIGRWAREWQVEDRLARLRADR